MLRALVKNVTFALAFAASAALVWHGSTRLVELSDGQRGGISLDFIAKVREWRRDLARDRSSLRVALIGDSMLWAPSTGTSLADRIWRLANGSVPSRDRLSLHTLTWPALTMNAEYCMADEFIGAHPTLVVLELNLRAVQPGGLGASSYPELAGWIRWPRLARAAFIPLSDSGVTLDRLLLYRFLVKNDLSDEWRGLLDRQSRIFNVRDTVEGWVEKRTGVETIPARQAAGVFYAFGQMLIPKRLRATRPHAVASLGAILDGVDPRSSRLRVLRALLGDFERARIPVLVWVSPINLEHLRSLGLSTAHVDESMATIRTLVESTGASFLDLHAILPDAGFHDSGDHYTLEGDRSGAPDGTAVVAAQLAPAVRRAALAARDAARSGRHAVQ